MGENTVLRLCAEVVRAAAGLDDNERPVMERSAEQCRVLAIRAKDENDALRARVAELEVERNEMRGHVRVVLPERRFRHIDPRRPAALAALKAWAFGAPQEGGEDG